MNGLTRETLRQSFGQSLSGNAALRCVLVLALGAPLLGGCAASATWATPGSARWYRGSPASAWPTPIPRVLAHGRPAHGRGSTGPG